MKVKINCKFCKKETEVSSSEIKRGYGKYCSKLCSYTDKEKYIKMFKKPNTNCAFCNKPIYRNIHKQNACKSKLFFCCRKHKDLAQRIGGIKEIQPSHYSNIPKDYRIIAFRNKPKICEECNYSKYPEILVVHHIDRNRKNNKITNLRILCPNCHAIEHYIKDKQG